MSVHFAAAVAAAAASFSVADCKACGAGGGEGYAAYEARLAAACAPYRHVIMIGDSMGATAALLFAHLATEVHAWTPQVDLAISSIRCGGRAGVGGALELSCIGVQCCRCCCWAVPHRSICIDRAASTPLPPLRCCPHGRPAMSASWQSTLKHRVLENAAACRGSVVVHTGTWRHDLDQARRLPTGGGIKVQVGGWMDGWMGG